VPLPRPRQRSHAIFAALVEKILERVLKTKTHSQELVKGESTLAELQPTIRSSKKLDEY
jgi:sulfonate transport system ATP-binding protein